jgi:hypothetical protein
MADFSETEMNIDKKDLLSVYEKISKFLLKDFEKKYENHKSMKHTWFIQNTVHGICRSLIIDKQLAIYIILGANPRREAWGNLKEKYEIDPLKFFLRKEIVSKGKVLDKELEFKVYFTDTNRNGDFHMKVTFGKKEKPVNIESEGFTLVKNGPKNVDDSKPKRVPEPIPEVTSDSKTPKEFMKDLNKFRMIDFLESSSDDE